MEETLYSARRGLAEPGRFLAAAAADLRASLFVGWHFFLADLRARNRHSVLGWLWLVIPAAAAAFLCAWLRSSRVIEVGATDLPFALHVLTGFLLWQVFLDALNAPLNRLLAARQLISRTRIPHEAVLLGGAFAVGLNALVRLAILLVALPAFGLPLGPSLFLLPLAMVALAVLGFFFGLLVAPWGLLAGDVRQGLLLVAAFWFFLTPIFYPAPGSGPLLLNPVTPLIEAGRSWLLSPAVHPAFVAVAGASLLGLVMVWLVYRLVRPHVVARLG